MAMPAHPLHSADNAKIERVPGELQLSVAELVAFLKSTDVFSSLGEEYLTALAGEFECLSLAAGKTLMRRGDPGDCLYVVLGGRLQVLIDLPDGTQRAVAELGTRECVGEMSLLTAEPRSATVRAIRDSTLVMLSRRAFDRLVETHPQTMMAIARVIVLRLKRTTAAAGHAVNTVTTFAVLPVSGHQGITRFCEQLLAELEPEGRGLHLTGAGFDGRVQPGASQTARSDPGNALVVQRLDVLEREHPIVVYECDPVPSEWTRRCVRQADRLLIVGHEDGEPALTETERALAAEEEAFSILQKHFVLLHKDAPLRPSGTAAWLAPREVVMHHHARSTSREDVARIARLLTGRGIALVLGGGGARGFAHIGVLRAMHELGIPIDMVGGTSMGAVIAAQCAMGLSVDEMLDMNERGWIGVQPFSGYTVPLIALLDGKALVRMLKMMFEDWSIEDLPTNFYCVSTNLTRAEYLVHRRGSLWRWIRASASVPGVGPPLLHQGDVIVDGGMLNNLPVDVMRRLCNGRIIAVDVSLQVDLATEVDDMVTASGWQLLWRRLRPWASKPNIPSILGIMGRVANVASVNNTETQKALADLYLRPPVDGVGMFSWKSLKPAAEDGYDYSFNRLKEWYTGVAPRAEK